jgi:hypothetical protein
MVLFWIIGLILVVVISFILAWRSMKDFKETHITSQPYSLFLVKNPHILDENLLAQIHTLLSELNGIISFERLLKGTDKVLVIYAPSVIKEKFPQLDLFELEDYLEPMSVHSPMGSKTTLNQVLGWTIASKNNPKKIINVKSGFLSLVDLKEDQKFFLQVVCQPIENRKNNGTPESQFGQFQVTMRCLVADENPNQRIELSKKMDSQVFDSTGLVKQARQQTNQQIYEEYIKRVFVPKEVAKNFLLSQEILSLIK